MRRSPQLGKSSGRPLGLAARFSLLAGALLSALMTQVTLAGLAARQAETERNAQFNAARVADLAAAELAPLSAAQNLSAVQQEMAVLLSSGVIIGAELRDPEGFSLVRTGKTTGDSAYRIVLDRPLDAADGRSVRLHFDQRKLTPPPGSILPSVAAPLLAIVLASILVFLVMRRELRPLRDLTAFAERVSTQRLTDRLQIDSKDEFQTLANAFNHMLDRLEASVRRMRKLAFVDPVTELPNQEHFLREVRMRVEAAQHTARPTAVIVVAVEKLNEIADTYGQEAMQELLAVLGARLIEAVRTADRTIRVTESAERPAVCARLSGPEFAILAPELSGAAAAGRMAQMLVSAIAQPLQWRGQKLRLDAASGIALVPKDASDADGALRQARLALRAARRDGRPVRYFTRSLDREAVARVTLEREMREGLERGQFRAFFQPKVNLADGQIVGAEALARWVRPSGVADVGPGAFIPAAEQNGLIAEIAEAILRDACWKAAAWEREGFPIDVAVNVSAMQFLDDRFAQRILNALETSGLSPRLLEIEITESVAMTDPDRVARMIAPLREAGVRFAIDDFGTGHSSLAALTRLPFDVIKIDQQFVRGLATDRHAPAIVETILAMAASLNFRTVAEGVETEAEAEFLRQRGCEVAQGFLFGRAAPPAQLLERLRAARAPSARAHHAA